jgi:hypothetical protein
MIDSYSNNLGKLSTRKQKLLNYLFKNLDLIDDEGDIYGDDGNDIGEVDDGEGSQLDSDLFRTRIMNGGSGPNGTQRRHIVELEDDDDEDEVSGGSNDDAPPVLHSIKNTSLSTCRLNPVLDQFDPNSFRRYLKRLDDTNLGNNFLKQGGETEIETINARKNTNGSAFMIEPAAKKLKAVANGTDELRLNTKLINNGPIVNGINSNQTKTVNLYNSSNNISNNSNANNSDNHQNSINSSSSMNNLKVSFT